MAIFDSIKAFWTAQKFKRSTLGVALTEHSRRYFYSGQILSALDEATKAQMIADVYTRLNEIAKSANPVMDLRKSVADATILSAQLSVLCITEEEKEGQFYAANPFISGQLHHRIIDAAPDNEYLAGYVKRHPDANSEDLVDFANSQSAIHLYYANAFNMVRMEIGDHDPERDWFRPFFEAQVVSEEDYVRERLALPRLLPGPLHGLPYSMFLNCVVRGDINPLLTWRAQFPQLPLASDRS